MTDKRSHMKSDRLMNRIRTKGQVWLLWVTIFFVVSVFAGLGVGNFAAGQRTPGGGGAGDFFDGTVPEEAKFAAHIGGVKVDFVKFQGLVDSMKREQEAQSGGTMSPEQTLEVMNNIIESVINEELLRAYGKRNSVTVSDTEVRDRVNEFKSQFISAGGAEPEDKTILGEMKRSLGSGKSGEERWREWLVQNSYSDRDFFDEQKSSLAIEKARKHLEDKIIAKKAEVAEKIRNFVDAELEKGRKFEDLVRLFSFDFYTRDQGGEIPIAISPGFFNQEFDDAVFKLKTPGEFTPWFKTEFGWEKAQLIERNTKEKDKTLDELREELVSEIRKTKADDKYEPTEDELNEAYELIYTTVKVRHLTLSEMASIDMAKHLEKLKSSAQILIVHPLVRGYRAMNGFVNEQMESAEPAVEVKSHLAAEDFQILEGDVIHADRLDEAIRLLNEGKLPKHASWYVTPASESADKLKKELLSGNSEPDEAGEGESAEESPVPVEEGPYVSEPPQFGSEPGEPRYEEAVNGFMVARDKVFRKMAAPYYYVGWCYQTWLEDEKYKSQLPITEEEAKTIIKDSYSEASELSEYEPFYHFALAKFLFDEGDSEGALAAADKAFEYAGLNKEILLGLRGLYTKAAATEKLTAVNDKIKLADEREKERQAGSGGMSMPIEIPVDGGEGGPDIQLQFEDPMQPPE